MTTTEQAIRVATPPATLTPPNRKHQLSARVRTTAVLSYLVLILLALIYIYPFLISIAGSFKTDSDATQDPLSLIPATWTSAAYERLFTSVPLLQWTANSAFITVIVTIGRVFFDSLAGYALSRLRFRGRTIIFAGVVAVMAVPGVVLLIPRFLMLKELGLYDSFGGMILPLVIDAAGIFIMKQFFESIPVSVEEAARIDGAGVFRTFWTVVLPMARPAIITLFILSFQGSWNEFSHFVISRQDPALNTLTTGVASLTSGELGTGNQYPLQLAAAVLMSIPVVVIFFIFQKRLMNTTDGGEKG
ncbi:sugar ABC transporter permease [Salinibacterium xinjiangense]|uniref:Carbohydrate ABC transporter membrane protein 2, CUT1 family n=1 Tax=Salinibacterium xinjiangense TaxID=386302 RepID=A0A2C8Z409_9MICO|nr:carbohydrate ABC transporter permease [Salinibacterium xinjiangense]GGK93852.1 sugar ABC transporter permease [Salinibacterium xinjiangense]SOE58346.1 carbohydrate ABC transporter membrane protein 2, CUT1 family [Salinibacterium xinjiangense]